MLKLFKRVNFKQVFWFFFYFFLFSLLLRHSFAYLDPDFGWHLQVGQEIAQTRSVPSLNNYDYTFNGSWVDHEWLSNLLIYVIYSRTGYIMLSIIFSLLIILVLILLSRAARRLRPQAFLSIVILQIAGVMAALPHFGVRIQELGLLFIFLLLVIIDDYQKRQDWRILIFLPPLMYIWACLHASFLIGFFLLFSWLGVKVIERLLKIFYFKTNSSAEYLDLSSLLSIKKMAVYAGIAGASFIFTLFTPYKSGLYSFLEGYRNTFYLSHIQEWLSQFSFPFQYWQLFYLAFVALALLFYIYYSFSQEKYFKLNLWTVFLAGLFIILSFKSRRHFPLLFVATFIFSVGVYNQIFMTYAVKTGRKWLNVWLEADLLICLFLLSILNFSQTQFTANPFDDYCQDYPCHAVSYLRRHPELDILRILNNYSWGGYLIRQLPERQLFIDGRLPQVEFAGHTFLEEYLDFFKAGTRLEDKLNQYQIKLILMPAIDPPIVVRNWEKVVFGIKENELDKPNYLRIYLNGSSDWRAVYGDSAAVIYQKIKE